MRRITLALVLSLAAGSAPGQQATLAAPDHGFGNYDPTLSAKEAVLANWELAASGIRAGEVLGEKVLALAEEGASYKRLRRQAEFVQDTMLSRYHAAAWIYVAEPDLARIEPETLRAMVAATRAVCEGACDAERAALVDAFGRGAKGLEAAALEAREAIVARQPVLDAVLMSEQLGLMADYLESGDWAEDLVLTEFGMDVEVAADRIVGTIALWRNVEPYVGLANQEIDHAINAATEQLLRTLRRDTRGLKTLDGDAQVVATLQERAETLAAEFRRASALFAS